MVSVGLCWLLGTDTHRFLGGASPQLGAKTRAGPKMAPGFLPFPSQQLWQSLAAHSIGPWPLLLASVTYPPSRTLSQEGTSPHKGRGRQQDAAGRVAEMLVSQLFL